MVSFRDRQADRAVVEIIHDRKRYGGGTLVQEWGKDDEKGYYKIIMNKKLINLYGPAQWTAIDWSQRQKLRKQPLAQALHAFCSSHEKPYPLKLETLKKITDSRNPRWQASSGRPGSLLLFLNPSVFLRASHFRTISSWSRAYWNETGYDAQSGYDACQEGLKRD